MTWVSNKKGITSVIFCTVKLFFPSKSTSNLNSQRLDNFTHYIFYFVKPGLNDINSLSKNSPSTKVFHKYFRKNSFSPVYFFTLNKILTNTYSFIILLVFLFV